MKYKDTDKVIKELVSKINEDEIEATKIGANIRELNDFSNNNDNNKSLIDYIKTSIQSCTMNDDLVQALAIVDYSLRKTCVGYEDLRFIYNDDTYLSGHDDFAIEFIGHCEALHYI